MTSPKSNNQSILKAISPQSQLLFLKEYKETRTAIAVIRVLFLCLILGLIWIIAIAYHPHVSAGSYQLSPTDYSAFMNQLGK